ncbi:MAG: hypothetical protein KDA60_19085 [Planctomycetales bacterium]|nr:hypothetical protein [Planctomycetales bacterium]
MIPHFDADLAVPPGAATFDGVTLAQRILNADVPTSTAEDYFATWCTFEPDVEAVTSSLPQVQADEVYRFYCGLYSTRAMLGSFEHGT